MQRIVKFRGKTVGGEWVIGNYAHIKKDFSTVKKGHYISNSAGAPFAFLVRPETVGQFTGLLDKNGKDIYEGDVLKWYVNNIQRTAPIYYDNLQASFWMGKEFGTGFLVLNDWMRGKYEVLGNIHDNPELLK